MENKVLTTEELKDGILDAASKETDPAILRSALCALLGHDWENIYDPPRCARCGAVK